MKNYSVLLRWLFFISFATMGAGFGCHFFYLHCKKIADFGALLLIASPALGFLYLTGYYLIHEKNHKLSILAFFVFLILLLNMIL